METQGMRERFASGEETSLRVGCKINLTLRITGVRPDGWHELDTVFVPLREPFDTLRLSPGGGAGLTLGCDVPGIDPADNTLTKAYRLFAEASGFRPAVKATLEKGIPHGAGLGGGSADAAALLGWLNAIAPAPLPVSDLAALAARIGADVPFFLYNVPCRASGIGERLAPCPAWLEESGVGGASLVLLCPAERVSTPWAYGAWDRWAKSRPVPLTEGRNEAINHASQNPSAGRASIRWLENSFEPPVFEVFPRLRRLRERLLREGAFAAVMSGSGSSLFGLFRRAEDARRVAEGFREKDVAVHVHAL